MDLINQNQNGAFSARGVCPHCSLPSFHVFVVGPYIKPASGQNPLEANVLVQCQNCQGVVYVVGIRNSSTGVYEYKESFPVDNPEASVDETIPAAVRDDFVEALRCKSITAYRATVVMCRRALQSSCKDQKATGTQLIQQIDDLAAKGVITRSLQNMAHQIRKLGNAGAHPDDDALSDVTAEDANDISEFTRQYFEHVYVMPARMAELVKRHTPSTAAATSQ